MVHLVCRMTKGADVKDCKRVYQAVIVALLALVGCGVSDGDKAAEFNSLLVLVEEGESVLEGNMVKWKGALEDFASCVVEATLPAFTCEESRADLESILASTAEKYSLADLRARLQSLRLADNDEASRARDAFVRHLRAWHDYVVAFQLTAPSQSDLFRADYGFAAKWGEISSDEIGTTFDETCSGLGNGQPPESDEFAGRIVDICDD